MMHHIDVSTVLRGAVCELYSNLVTRPTGAAVRTAIEALLAEGQPPTITTIDFSHVNLIDFSCADEIVAKLLLQHVATTHEEARYVFFRGMREDHLDAVEAVLEHRELALVWDRDGRPELLGRVDEDERRAWNVVRTVGPVWAPHVADSIGASTDHAELQLTRLWHRRLVMRQLDGYVVPGVVRGVAA